MTTTETMSNTSFNATTEENKPPEEGLDDVNVILSVLIGLVGVVGNTGVLVVLGSSQQMRRKLINVCLMNQSAIDLAASLLLIVNGTQDPNVKIKFTGKPYPVFIPDRLMKIEVKQYFKVNKIHNTHMKVKMLFLWVESEDYNFIFCQAC